MLFGDVSRGYDFVCKAFTCLHLPNSRRCTGVARWRDRRDYSDAWDGGGKERDGQGRSDLQMVSDCCVSFWGTPTIKSLANS